MHILKAAIVVAAPAAFVLAACERQEPIENLAIDTNEVIVGEPEAGDPATANLTLDSPPAEVDQAINEVDAEANLGNEVQNLQ